MNYFYGTANQIKVVKRIFKSLTVVLTNENQDMPRTGIEPAQIVWNCAVAINATSWHHYLDIGIITAYVSTPLDRLLHFFNTFVKIFTLNTLNFSISRNKY